MRQMTFEIPEDVAEDFNRVVPVSEQSAYVARQLQLIVSKPTLTEEQWDAICDAANNDPETQEIEREMAALPDTMTEDWHGSVPVSETR